MPLLEDRSKKKDVDMILSATLDAIGKLCQQAKGQLTGFRALVRHRAERMGETQAKRKCSFLHQIPAFKAGKLLRIGCRQLMV